MSHALYSNMPTPALLAADISATATSITLQSGGAAMLPTITGSNYIWATLFPAAQRTSGVTEIVKITAVVGEVLTVTRAQQGTTGTAYLLGDKLEVRVTADGLEEFSITSEIATDLATSAHAATAKTLVVDADEISLFDSAASWVLKKFTLTTLWTWIQSHLAAPGDIGGTTPAAGLFTTINASGAITGDLTGNVTGDLTGDVTGNLEGAVVATTVSASGDITGSTTILVSSSGLIGYQDQTLVSGWGVTQLTSKTTAVTLNKPFGTIESHNAALDAGAIATFTLNNSLISARDIILVNGYDTVGNVDHYSFTANAGTGLASIGIHNMTAGSRSENVYVKFAILRCGSILV